MDLMQSFDAILFPADGRPPHVVSLMTSPASFSNPHAPAQTSATRIPHPEVHMEYIAEDPNMRAWLGQVCCVACFAFPTTSLLGDHEPPARSSPLRGTHRYECFFTPFSFLAHSILWQLISAPVTDGDLGFFFCVF